VYRSTTTLPSSVSGAPRNAVTDIYFLLLSGQVSRFHRVLHDEIWHFYEGDPLELVEIEAEFSEVAKIVLHGQTSPPQYKHCIRGGNWQAAFPRGDYSLVGCTVAPGFDFADFEFMAENAAAQSALLARFPELKTLL
jgi:predicted cupin superfamily sugar epimerase